MVKSCLW